MELRSRNELNELLRVDLKCFVQRVFQTVAPGTTYQDNWHIEVMCHHLMLCFSGDIKRLIITVPPRHLKSICTSIGFVAWLLARDPRLRSIVVTYSNELSDYLSRLFRAVVIEAWYQELAPALKVAKDTGTEFMTTQKGFRYATSIGGTLTGRGADFIIIDDPIKAEDALSKSARETVISWYRTTLISRLDKKKDGCVIVVMQRHHVDDLVGHLLETDPTGWVHLDLPAIAQRSEDIPIGDSEWYHREPGDLLFPERESLADLEQIRRDMGSATYSAQYLQRPVPEQGNSIKLDWFRYYDDRPVRGPDDRVIQSWDTAMKANQQSDHSVCTPWLDRNGTYYLIDVARERVDFPNLKRLAVALRDKFKPDVILIEDKGSGTALIQELSTGALRPIPINPKGEKEHRMNIQLAKINAGQVLLPRDAPWLSEFLLEVLAFPKGRHDDQVDSLSQFLEYAGQSKRANFSYEFIDVSPVSTY